MKPLRCALAAASCMAAATIAFSASASERPATPAEAITATTVLASYRIELKSPQSPTVVIPPSPDAIEERLLFIAASQCEQQPAT